MANMIRTPSSPGIKIENSIVEEYYANTETINANTFVEFINGKPTVIISAASDYDLLSACKLDDTRVFCMYSGGAGKKDYPYGVVLTVNRTEITVGTPLHMSSLGYYSSDYIKLMTLDSNRVFMALRAYTSHTLCFRIIEISGDTITIGDYVSSGITGSDGYKECDIVKIAENDVVVIASNRSLKFIRCTISGNSITIAVNRDLKSYTDFGSSYYLSRPRIAYNPNASYRFLFLSYIALTSTTNYYSAGGPIICMSLDLYSEGAGDEETTLNIGRNSNASPVTFITSTQAVLNFVLFDTVNKKIDLIDVSDSNVISINQSKDVTLDTGSIFYPLRGSNNCQPYVKNDGTMLYVIVFDGSVHIVSFEIQYNTDNSVQQLSYIGVKIIEDTGYNNISYNFYGAFSSDYSSIFYAYEIDGSYKNPYARHYYFEDLIKASETKIDGITKTKALTNQKGKVFVLNTEGGN